MDKSSARPAARQRDVYNLGYKDLDMIRFSLIMPLGSASIKFITYPPTLVKTRLMSATPDGAVVYRNTRHAFMHIAHHEGFRSLYKGFTIGLMTLPLGTVYLNTMEITKSVLVEHAMLDSRDAFLPFVAAGFASSVTQTIGVPIDIVTQRLMMCRERKSPLKARIVVRDVWNKEGIRGFYRGYIASLLCFAPNSAIVWSIYSNSRHWMRSRSPHDSALTRINIIGLWNLQEVLISTVCGFTAGISAALMTNPLDIVRTRQQTHLHPITYRETIAEIFKSKGLLGFYRGASARALATGPSAALSFSSYEILKQLSIKDYS